MVEKINLYTIIRSITSILQSVLIHMFQVVMDIKNTSRASHEILRQQAVRGLHNAILTSSTVKKI